MDDYQSVPESVSVPREGAKKYFLKIGLAVLLLPIVTTVLQYAAAFAFAAFAPKLYNSWWFLWLLSTIPLYCVAFPIFVYVLPKPADKIGEKRPFGVGKLVIACIIAVSAMYLFNIIGFNLVKYIKILSGGRLGQTDALNTIVNASPTWVTVAIACIVGPVMEEIIFRKVLMDRVLPFGEFRACLLSAIVFGLFHGNFHQFFYATALGFIVGYVYAKARNIFYSVGMHMGINLLGTVVVPNILSAKNLDAVERAAADPFNITNSDAVSVLLVTGTVIVGVGLVLAGVILFFVFLKKIKFDAPKYEVEGGKATKMLMLNPAMIAAMVVMAAAFVTALL